MLELVNLFYYATKVKVKLNFFLLGGGGGAGGGLE